MAPSVQRTLSEQIPATPADVRDFYVDLTRLAEVHPLVVAVTSVSRHTFDGGYQQTYRVKDVVPVGFWRLPVTYTAALRVPEKGPVHTEARQFPRVRLSAEVTFDPVDGGTLLTERIRISAPRVLLALTAKRATAAHMEMLAGIRRRFERA